MLKQKILQSISWWNFNPEKSLSAHIKLYWFLIPLPSKTYFCCWWRLSFFFISQRLSSFLQCWYWMFWHSLRAMLMNWTFWVFCFKKSLHESSRCPIRQSIIAAIDKNHFYDCSQDYTHSFVFSYFYIRV